MKQLRIWFVSWAILAVGLTALHAAEAAKLSVLFLGDTLNESGHDPQRKAEILVPAMSARGISVTYTDDVKALNPATLAQHDCLLLYNNIHDLAPAEEGALLDFVEQGKGLVVLHCSSFAFRNSEKYIALVGGQFASHGNEVFRPFINDAQHPAMRGLKSFELKDESYVHAKTSNDRRVLMLREHAEGYEPWTWVRAQGKGRVFYSASGHSSAVWQNADFQKLVEQGIRWAAGRLNEDLSPLKLIPAPARIPRYTRGAAWGTQSEDVTLIQAPLPPEESMKHIHLPEGFQVELFASEPDIVKPIAMTWDERGRLWVVESVDYPNNLMADSHQNGNDRVKICEDTDGDGRADKFTLFADKLNVPTGIAFARGGVILAIAPHLLFLKDTDGDDRADVREILYTGFGRRDTHAVLANLRYGHDNWMYGSIGYSGGDIKVGNTSTPLRAGLFRFRADGSAFEFLTATSNNTWGFGENEDGDLFGSTANNEHAVHLAIPNRYFESVRGWSGKGSAGIEDHKQMHPATADVRQVDVFGGFTAASGFETYAARSYPQQYWKDVAFVCEPTGHLVHLDKLVRHGSEFAARDGYNFLASSDSWTSPIYAQVGPDGAVWVADWYNYIIQHNPTPKGFTNGPGNAYATPMRDQERGRIYRVVHNQAKPAERLNLAKATPSQVVATLGHDNMFWRLTAQRWLVNRGLKDVVPALARLVSGANAFAAQHALRTLDGLEAFVTADSVMNQVLSDGLKHSSPGARRAALGVLPRRAESAGKILKANLLADAEALVRKDALLALAEMPATDEAGGAIAAFLNDLRNANDRWLPLAAASAAAQNDLAFLKAAAPLLPGEKTLKPLTQSVRVCAEHYARGSQVDGVASIIASFLPAQTEVADALVAGLAAGWPVNRPPAMTPQLEDNLNRLWRKVSLSVQLQLASLANRWGVGEKFQADLATIKDSLLAKITATSESEDSRVKLAQDLMSVSSDGQTVNKLLGVITPQTSPEFSRGVLQAVGQSPLPEVASAIVARWANFTPRLRQTALGLLLSRAEWTRLLLDSLEQNRIPVSDLSVDQVQRLTRNPDSDLAERAQKLIARGGRLPNLDRQKVVDAAMPLTKRHGDLAAGKQVFVKNCAVCHRLNGEGGLGGPDLTGFAGGNREELLINILDPNRSVEGNFRQFTIDTKDDQSLNGLLIGETKTTVEVLDAQGQKRVVLRQDIKQLTSSELSLMPEGFESLTAEEMVSLLDYLSARGRFLPLPLQKVANAITTQGMFIEPGGSDRMIFDAWTTRTFFGVPFNLLDPRGNSMPNALVLHSPMTPLTQTRDKSATVICNGPAKAIHLLSGASGWGFPAAQEQSLTMTVRCHYSSGATEDHGLTNGVHFSDYLRRVDVPGSKFAAELQGGKQIRYVAVFPKRAESIEKIEFVKGPDRSAPVIMAVTVESPDEATGSARK